MSQYRPLTEKNKYYIPKEDYLTAVHYSLRYPLWQAEIKDARDTATAIRYDKDKVQTSPNGDLIFNAAVRAGELQNKVDLIDGIINDVAEGLDHYLLLGVCYGLTFEQLKAKEMPCERDMYYRIRRRYYYELSRLI